MKINNELTIYQSIRLWQIDKIGLVLMGALGFPLLLHVVPSFSSVPKGAVWLPIFYAPLIAVFFFRPHVSMISALMVPTVNRLLTGMPQPAMAKVLTIELFVFVLISQLLVQRSKEAPSLTGVGAYLGARIVSVLVLGMMPLVIDGGRWAYWLTTTQMALPGLIIIFVLTIICKSIKERDIARD